MCHDVLLPITIDLSTILTHMFCGVLCVMQYSVVAEEEEELERLRWHRKMSMTASDVPVDNVFDKDSTVLCNELTSPTTQGNINPLLCLWYAIVMCSRCYVICSS